MGGEYPEESDFPGEFARLRALMSKYGGADKRIIVSEVGNSTYPVKKEGTVTPLEQANTIVRTLINCLATPNLDMVLWYRFDDTGFVDWGEHHCGIVEPFLNPKPAYVAVATMTRLLPNPVFRRWIQKGPEVFAAELAGADNRLVTVAYSKRTPQDAQLECPGGTKLVLIWGTEKPAKSGTIRLTEEPVFLVSAEPVKISAADAK